jgi:hypothetical protein
MGPGRHTLEREERARRRAEAEARRRTTRQMREDAACAIIEWNGRLQRDEPISTVRTIGAALAVGYYWATIFCPGCRTVVDLDLRTIDRHPDAAVTSLLTALRCSFCVGNAPMPRLLGLAQFKTDPTRKASDVGRTRADGGDALRIRRRCNERYPP